MIRIARGAMVRSRFLLRPRRIAHAHSGTHSYVYVIIGDGRVTGNVQFPVRDLNKVASLAIPQDEPSALAAMATNSEEIRRYALQHVVLQDDRGPWTIRFTGDRVLARKKGSYAILEYEVTPPLDRVPRQFTVTYDGIIESDDHHEAIVIVRTSAGWGNLRTQTDEQIPFAAGSTTQVVTIPEDSAANDAKGAAAWVATNAKELWRRARKRLRR